MMNKKQVARWTDLQTVTFFRNALRRKVQCSLTNGCGPFKMENVKTQFEHDYKVTHTVSLVIQKLPDNEIAMQYISRCAEILLELKTKTDVLDVKM